MKTASFSSALMQGLAFFFLIYAVGFTVVVFQSRKIFEEIENKTPSVTVVIGREGGEQVVSVPSPDETVHIEQQPPSLPVEDPHKPQAQETTPDNNELVENTPDGPLPKKAANGMTAFKAYKKTFDAHGAPMVILVVADYGLSELDSKDALKKLPAGVSFVLSPYSRNYDVWRDLSSAEGHEMWLQLPVENERYPTDDPGPKALIARSDFRYNRDNLTWVMSRTTGYAGIAAYTDNAFVNAEQTMTGIANDIFKRGLGYFEMNNSGLDFIEVSAVNNTAPYAKGEFILDETTQNVPNWLSALQSKAQAQGYAVGIIKPVPHVVELVSRWVNEAQGSVVFAPISVLAEYKKPAPVSAPFAPATVP